MAVPDAVPSLIFDLVLFDEDDPVDKEMTEAHTQLAEAFQGKSEMEIHNYLQENASLSASRHNEIINGLLYGILTTLHRESSKPQDFFHHLNFVSRDSLGFAMKQTRYFCSLHNFHKMRPIAKEQLLWLVGRLTEVKVLGVDSLYMILLRQIRGGDVTASNIQLAESLLRLLQEHIDWVHSHPGVTAHACYTYLRVMLDHIKFPALRHQEVVFCVGLLRTRFKDCSEVGRDLIRALQDVGRIKEFEEIWSDLLHNPQKLNPQLEGIHQIMAASTPVAFLASRVSFDMEHKLLHILKYIHVGQHHRNLQWFIDRYLSNPETDALYCDLIRYICGVYHPTNAVLASPVVPRYVLIGGLLRVVRSPVAAANIKLALFYDWLFFDPLTDNIMNIEPAILLMERSVERYPYITTILLEFLAFTVEEYHKGLRDYIHKHVGMAIGALLEKGVIRSLQPIYRSPSLDEFAPVREYMMTLFSKHMPDVGEMLPSASVPHPLETGRVDEFESSPPHTGYVAHVAGQDGDDDDEDEPGSTADDESKELEKITESVDSLSSKTERMEIDSGPSVEDKDQDEELKDEVMESFEGNTNADKANDLDNGVSMEETSVASTELDQPLSSSSASSSAKNSRRNSMSAQAPSLWIFGNSLKEFHQAFESRPTDPATMTRFRGIWETYGEAEASGVESHELARTIGIELAAVAEAAQIPEKYCSPSEEDMDITDDSDYPSGSNDAGPMDAVVRCLGKVTDREGQNGALKIADVLQRSEANKEYQERVCAAWYLIGLIRWQRLDDVRSLNMYETLQLYRTFLENEVEQDLSFDRPAAASNVALVQEYLVRDLRLLQDRQLPVFEQVLPLVLGSLWEIVPKSESFLRLILSGATPAFVYRIAVGLSRRDFSLFAHRSLDFGVSKNQKASQATSTTNTTRATNKKSLNAKGSKGKNTKESSMEISDSDSEVLTRFEGQWVPEMDDSLLEILEQTLDWDTFDQIALWQWLVSEFGGEPEAVAKLMRSKWIPKLSAVANAESITGVSNLTSTILALGSSKLGQSMAVAKSIAHVAGQGNKVSSDMMGLCVGWFKMWGSRGHASFIGKILTGLCADYRHSLQEDPQPEKMDNKKKKELAKIWDDDDEESSKGTLTDKKRSTLTKAQRIEAGRLELSSMLNILKVWWTSKNAVDKTLFGLVWTERVRNLVQETLSEGPLSYLGTSSWPSAWWTRKSIDATSSVSRVKKAAESNDVSRRSNSPRPRSTATPRARPLTRAQLSTAADMDENEEEDEEEEEEEEEEMEEDEDEEEQEDEDMNEAKVNSKSNIRLSSTRTKKAAPPTPTKAAPTPRKSNNISNTAAATARRQSSRKNKAADSVEDAEKESEEEDPAEGSENEGAGEDEEEEEEEGEEEEEEEEEEESEPEKLPVSSRRRMSAVVAATSSSSKASPATTSKAAAATKKRKARAKSSDEDEDY